MNPPLLTQDELCKALGRSPELIADWRRLGMPCIAAGPRTLLFDLDDVVVWLKRQFGTGDAPGYGDRYHSVPDELPPGLQRKPRGRRKLAA